MSYELPRGSEVVGENWDDNTLPIESLVKPERSDKQKLIDYISKLSEDEIQGVLYRLSIPVPIIARSVFTNGLNTKEK
jgi:hypothetical protein